MLIATETRWVAGDIILDANVQGGSVTRRTKASFRIEEAGPARHDPADGVPPELLTIPLDGRSRRKYTHVIR
jgi:hypothetical protein